MSTPLGTYGEANKEFIQSAEMRKLADPTTIGANADKRQYLENRLLEAFRLGLRKGEQIAAERISKFVRGDGN